jgi:hypothetical protein
MEDLTKNIVISRLSSQKKETSCVMWGLQYNTPAKEEAGQADGRGTKTGMRI